MDVDHLDDLLARIAMQDRRALRSLYEGTVARLLAVASRLLDDRASAEDVVQDMFITVWTRAAQLPELRSHPMAWLTAMVRNRSIDALRRKRPEVPMQWHGSDGETHQYDAPDSSGSPLDQLLEMQSDDQLAGCLGALDDEPRQAILLAYFEGLTHVELARRLGRPLGTVKAWVRRSLGQLRECLGEPA